MRALPLLLALLPLTMDLSGQGVTTVLYPGGSNPSIGAANAMPFDPSLSSDLTFQIHIPASDLLPRPAMLTDIAFAPVATGSYTINTLMLSVGHDLPGAPVCTFASNSGDLWLLFGGSHQYTYTADSWSSLGLPLDFAFRGGQGLIIELRVQGSSGGGLFRTADIGTNVLRVYNRLPGGFSASSCSYPASLGPRLALTFKQAEVVLAGIPVAGTLLPLTFGSPSDPGAPFVAALSLGTGPLLLGPADPRAVELSADGLFWATLGQGSMLPGFSGVLDGSGLAPGAIPLPATLPSGLTFHIAFATAGPSFPTGVRSVSLTRSVTLP